MKRNELWATVGILASLIGIITFVTGKQSLQEFFADAPPSTQIERSIPQPLPLQEPPANSSSLASTSVAGSVESPRPVASPTYAVLHTTSGVITLRLLVDRSPEHVARFVSLAKEGFYDTVQFRRVVPGVLVEANYRSDNPTLGSYQHPELSDVPFRRGSVGVSTGGDPLRENWWFFIVTDDAPYLNGMYTPLAEVQEGMDVVDKIAQAAQVDRWPWILSVDLR